MEDKTYRLSGHHLDNLISYYIHLDDFKSFRYDMSAEGLYDRQSVERVIDFHRKLISEPHAKVQLVEGRDDICRICCNETRCYDIQPDNVIMAHEGGDRKVLEKYGFKKGDVLSVGEIILNFVFLKISVNESANYD